MAIRVKLVYLADFRVLFGNEDPSVTTPVALMCLQKYALEKGGLSGSADISLHTFRSSATTAEMMRDIAPRDGEIIGVSCYFWNYTRSVRLIKAIKRAAPAATIILGGPESEETSRIMDELPEVDICVRGEGEELFAAILRHTVDGTPIPPMRGLTVRGDDGKPIDHGGRGMLMNMNDLPEIYSAEFLAAFPPGEIFYHSERGCKCSCNYCTLGPPLRSKDLPLVEPEVRRIFEHKNITYVNFWDSDMTWDLSRFKDILRMVEKYNTGGKLVSVNYGFLDMDDEVLALLGRNVHRIIMGFQSTNSATTELAGRKKYDLAERRRALEHAFRFIDPRRINAQFIFGLPGDDYSSLGESMKWAQGVGFTDIWVVQNLALPGTVYRRDAQKHGIEFKKTPFYNVYKTATYSRAAMKRSKSTLFWFVGLNRMYTPDALRSLAEAGTFIWDIADRFPYVGPDVVEENLEGGDMYDYSLKAGKIVHVQRLCLNMLQQHAKKHPDAAAALDALDREAGHCG